MASLPPGLAATYDHLARESKKRFPAVRDAASQALEIMHRRGGGDLGRDEDLLVNPFLLTCNHAAAPTKLVVSALSGIQLLASHRLLSPNQHSNVLRVMNLHCSSEEPVQLRVVQTIPILFNVEAGCELDEQAVSSSFSLFAELVQSTHAPVRQSAIAALRQVVALLFDPIAPQDGGRGASASPSHWAAAPATPQDAVARWMDQARGLEKAASRCVVDLCALVRESPPQLIVRAKLPPEVALEVLEAVLSSNVALFRDSALFRALLQCEVAPTVSSTLHRGVPYPLLLRAHRLVLVLLTRFLDVLPEGGGSLVTTLAYALSRNADHAAERASTRDHTSDEAAAAFGSSGEPSGVHVEAEEPESRPAISVPIRSPEWHWRRVLALEVLSAVLKERTVLACVHATPVPSGGARDTVFTFLVSGLAEVLHETVAGAFQEAAMHPGAAQHSGHAHGVGRDPSGAALAAFATPLDRSVPDYKSRPTRGVALSEAEPPLPSQAVVALTAHECLLSIVHALFVGTPSAEGGLHSPPRHGKDDDGAQASTPASAAGVESMVLASWRSLLACMSLTLAKVQSEELIQQELRAYVALTHTCGLLRLEAPRGAMLSSLCQFALPQWHMPRVGVGSAHPSSEEASPDDVNRLSKKNFMALHALVNIAHGLGAVMGTSWRVLLHTFEHLHAMLSTWRRPRAPAPEQSAAARLMALPVLGAISLSQHALGVAHSLAAAAGGEGGLRRVGLGTTPHKADSKAERSIGVMRGSGHTGMTAGGVVGSSSGGGGGSGAATAPTGGGSDANVDAGIRAASLGAPLRDDELEEEVAILSHGITQLFYTTTYLPDKALRDLLEALASLSVDYVAHASTVVAEMQVSHSSHSLASASSHGAGDEGSDAHHGDADEGGGGHGHRGEEGTGGGRREEEDEEDEDDLSSYTAQYVSQARTRQTSDSSDSQHNHHHRDRDRGGGGGIGAKGVPAQVRARLRQAALEGLGLYSSKAGAGVLGSPHRGASADSMQGAGPPTPPAATVGALSAAERGARRRQGGHGAEGTEGAAPASAPSGAGKAARQPPSPQGRGGDVVDGEDAVPPFALVQLVEVTRCNAFRITRVWDIVGAHLQMVAACRVLALRRFAAHALEQVALAALEPGPEGGGGSAQRQASREGGADPSRLVSTFAVLLTAPYSDVREQALGALLALLRGGGQVLGPGWAVVLTVLRVRDVASTLAADSTQGQEEEEEEEEGETNGEAPDTMVRGMAAMRPEGVAEAAWGELLRGAVRSCALSTGFKMLRLVVDEYADMLPRACLPLLAECAATYARQRDDVNLALGAIPFLWSVSDEVATAARAAASQGGGDLAASVEEAWGVLLRSLASLCRDERAEIRNGAVQTLFSLVTTHGTLLSGALWYRAMRDTVLPTLEEALRRATAQGAEAKEVLGPELGRNADGSSIRMVMHHSRNTQQKQWNETWALVVDGMSRVLQSCASPLRRSDVLPWWPRWLAALSTACLAADEAGASQEPEDTRFHDTPGALRVNMEVILAGLSALAASVAFASSDATAAQLVISERSVHYTTAMRVVGGALEEVASPTAAARRGGDGHISVQPFPSEESRRRVWLDTMALVARVARAPALLRDPEQRPVDRIAQALGSAIAGAASAELSDVDAARRILSSVDALAQAVSRRAAAGGYGRLQRTAPSPAEEDLIALFVPVMRSPSDVVQSLVLGTLQRHVARASPWPIELAATAAAGADTEAEAVKDRRDIGTQVPLHALVDAVAVACASECRMDAALSSLELMAAALLEAVTVSCGEVERLLASPAAAAPSTGADARRAAATARTVLDGLYSLSACVDLRRLSVTADAARRMPACMRGASRSLASEPRAKAVRGKEDCGVDGPSPEAPSAPARTRGVLASSVTYVAVARVPVRGVVAESVRTAMDVGARALRQCGARAPLALRCWAAAVTTLHALQGVAVALKLGEALAAAVGDEEAHRVLAADRAGQEELLETVWGALVTWPFGQAPRNVLAAASAMAETGTWWGALVEWVGEHSAEAGREMQTQLPADTGALLGATAPSTSRTAGSSLLRIAESVATEADAGAASDFLLEIVTRAERAATHAAHCMATGQPCDSAAAVAALDSVANLHMPAACRQRLAEARPWLASHVDRDHAHLLLFFRPAVALASATDPNLQAAAQTLLQRVGDNFLGAPAL